MRENLVVDKVTVDTSDHEFIIVVEVEDTKTKEKFLTGVSVDKRAPIMYMEEVFKKFTRQMQLLQFGDHEKVILPNNTNEED